MKTYREFKIWKNVSDEQWTDWKWQISHCISTLGELSEIVDLSPQEYEGVEKATKALKMRISPHIALMMANGDKEDTLRCQFVPSINEVKTADIDILYKDVNDDDGYSPVKGLVHRYPSVEKGIRQILDAIADIKKTPKPIDRTKWEAFRVDKKIPDDNGLLQDRVTYWVLRYYRYIEMQFKQGERTSLLRFKKVQNEVSQCFETFDEANMPQREIFERLVKWLEDQTDCHNRDAQEAMISFFVQNCEVFNETPE